MYDLQLVFGGELTRCELLSLTVGEELLGMAEGIGLRQLLLMPVLGPIEPLLEVLLPLIVFLVFSHQRRL